MSGKIRHLFDTYREAAAFAAGTDYSNDSSLTLEVGPRLDPDGFWTLVYEDEDEDQDYTNEAVHQWLRAGRPMGEPDGSTAWAEAIAAAADDDPGELAEPELHEAVVVGAYILADHYAGAFLACPLCRLPAVTAPDLGGRPMVS